jgi:hypothetical protein
MKIHPSDLKFYIVQILLGLFIIFIFILMFLYAIDLNKSIKLCNNLDYKFDFDPSGKYKVADGYYLCCNQNLTEGLIIGYSCKAFKRR